MNYFHDESLSRLTLGTAQLGLDYGIASPIGKPNASEAFAIMDTAWVVGMRCFDTARAYGDSEKRIGDWISKSGNRPILVSKLPPLGVNNESSPEIILRQHVEASCRALQVDKLDGYLTHRAEDFFLPGIKEELEKLVKINRIGAYGLSAYSIEDVLRASNESGAALAQFPVNVLDSRIRHSESLEVFSKTGGTIFGRSVFLQGALLMAPESLPEFLFPLKKPIETLDRLSRDSGRTRAAFLIELTRSLPAVSSIIVGADSPAQLRMAATTKNERLPASIVDEAWQIGQDLPDHVLDPRLWPKR